MIGKDDEVLIWVYTLPFGLVAAVVLLAPWLWDGGRILAVCHGKLRLWLAGNVLLLLTALLAILYITVFSRTPGTYPVILQPFHSLWEARVQPEMYRTMLMNVLLFEPFAMAFSQLLPEKWHGWLRVLSVLLTGVLLSVLVEWLQHHFSLGRVEADDVICNALGTCLGSMSFLAEPVWEKIRRALFN